jgi:hypothetical protein
MDILNVNMATDVLYKEYTRMRHLHRNSYLGADVKYRGMNLHLSCRPELRWEYVNGAYQLPNPERYAFQVTCHFKNVDSWKEDVEIYEQFSCIMSDLKRELCEALNRLLKSYEYN